MQKIKRFIKFSQTMQEEHRMRKRGEWTDGFIEETFAWE